MNDNVMEGIFNISVSAEIFDVFAVNHAVIKIIVGVDVKVNIFLILKGNSINTCCC